MSADQGISKSSRITLYVFLFLMAFYVILVSVFQIQVLQGKHMENPDGSADDWHEQKTHFGIAYADLVITLPMTVVGIASIFANRTALGHYLMSMIGFWFFYCNTMTTSTSLRFENPRIDFEWFIVFPSGAILGLAYIVWVLVHFDQIFLPSREAYSPIPEATIY